MALFYTAPKLFSSYKFHCISVVDMFALIEG